MMFSVPSQLPCHVELYDGRLGRRKKRVASLGHLGISSNQILNPTDIKFKAVVPGFVLASRKL